MTPKKIKIGIIDSGVSETQSKYILKGQRFSQNNKGEITISSPITDPLGHGRKVVGIIHSHLTEKHMPEPNITPNITNFDLFNAQVFNERGVTTAKIVAAAIDWLRSEEIDIIHLSLGLKEDREILEKACKEALSQNIIMVASSPAQGDVPYPAAYEGIISATGDARCSKAELSFLKNVQADFGGCPYGADDQQGAGGASLGAAHVTGHIAKILLKNSRKTANETVTETIKETLIKTAKYNGRERRYK